MMKSLLFVVLILFSIVSHANLKVFVSPLTPVKQETFNITFEVETSEDTDPSISFDPNGLEILGKRQEVSVSTSIINGRFSSSRKIKVVYEALSEKPRTYYLKNIRVNVGGTELKHRPVKISVLDKRKALAKIFLRAEVSKKEAFIGEGVDVRYYLYSAVPIVQTEFKTFPKLDGFIKRFHKVNEREERVNVNGSVYRKSLKYSARVYPEKTGKVFIDPLRLNLQYSTTRNNPFGSFGQLFNRIKSKGVSSSKVSINVLPLPGDDVPPHFTGLVGEHDFKFIGPKPRYLVNEAIEAKLEVTGPGALEKMNAPIIYQHDALEQFDTKSEFVEVGRSAGRKVFDYTYLARAAANIQGRTLYLSYFDPKEKKYKEKSVEISGISVGGSANAFTSSGIKPEKLNQKLDNSTTEPEPLTIGIAAPLFDERWKSIPLNWDKLLIWSFLVVILIQLIEFLLSEIKASKLTKTLERDINRIKKEGLNYSLVASLIYRLTPNKEGISLREVINKSKLSKRDKSYFIDVIDFLEKRTFGDSNQKNNKSTKKVSFRQSAFNSLKKEISSERV